MNPETLRQLAETLEQWAPNGEGLASAAALVRDLKHAEAGRLFLGDVAEGLRRARSLFPGDKVMTIALLEEAGELAKALLNEGPAAVWREAVQVAVMAARVAIDGDGSIDGWRTLQGLPDHRLGKWHSEAEEAQRTLPYIAATRKALSAQATALPVRPSNDGLTYPGPRIRGDADYGAEAQRILEANSTLGQRMTGGERNGQ